MLRPGETYCGGCEECREGNERWCRSPVPEDRDVRGGHDCFHDGMLGMEVCLICHERIVPKKKR